MFYKKSVPSVIGTIPIDIGGLENPFQNKSQENIEIVSLDSKIWYVGKTAELYTSDPVSNLSGEHFTDRNMLLPLTLASLQGAADGKPRTAIISLPINVLLNKDAQKKTKNAVKQILLGEHIYEFNGVPKHLIIEKINFTAQSLAALYSTVFDDSGNSLVAPDMLNEKIGVVDIGYGTMDLCTLSGLEIDPAGTSGCDLGVHVPLYELKAILRKKLNLNINDARALDILRGQRSSISDANGTHDVSLYVKQAITIWSAKVCAELQQYIGDGHEYAALLFTGGGAPLIYDHISHYKNAMIVNDPIYANALGCFRMGEMNNWNDTIGIDPGFYSYKVVF